MKKPLGILIFILTLTFQSCTKEEDDLISQNCDIDCTEIIGKLMTNNGTTPIVNREITVIWDNTSFGSGVIRTKATTTTNSNGEYSLKFFIRDDELDAGFHRMYYNKLDENEFIRADLNNISIYPTERDTILVRNHNVPKKGFLNLTLLNLEDIQQGDTFRTSFGYIRPTGYSQSISGLIRGWNNQYDSNQLIEIAGNQPIALEIFREINGVITRENDTLFVSTGNTLDYTIDFND